MGTGLEQAVAGLSDQVEQWADRARYTAQWMGEREAKMYCAEGCAVEEFRGKMWIEGPFEMTER